jgi:1-acyl-sn-glycerol-3-phosphate acyltransferase
VQTNSPVVPVALEGTARIMRKGAADSGDSLHTGDRGARRVVVRAGAPIAPRADGTHEERTADLCARVQAAVLAMHEELTRSS